MTLNGLFDAEYIMLLWAIVSGSILCVCVSFVHCLYSTIFLVMSICTKDVYLFEYQYKYLTHVLQTLQAWFIEIEAIWGYWSSLAMEICDLRVLK